MVTQMETIDLPIFCEVEKAWYDIPDHLRGHQLCVTTMADKTADPTFGSGSLVYDWGNATVDEWGKHVVPKFSEPMNECDFTEISDMFVGTVFERMVMAIKTKYNAGRVRIMPLLPKTCLTWHRDYDLRLHYPIITNEESMMVVEDAAFNIEPHAWTMVNTKLYHTVFNGGSTTRVHLVANILG